MSADYVQLIGTDVPGSYGSCCFSGMVQHEALCCPTQPVTHSPAPPPPPLLSSLSSATLTTLPGGDNQLLFFNCPEGTQRFSSEANVRLVRTRGFFFTRWTVSTVMGMPGMLFTINDAGVRHANFFGPSSHSPTLEDRDRGNGNGDTAAHIEESEHMAGRADATGLAGMLNALRRHYFWYRTMSFQQLRQGTVRRQLATPVPWNYVYEVPLHNSLNARKDDLLGGILSPPHLLSSSSFKFFVLALALSPTSALLGFRVSRKSSSLSEEEEEEEVYGYVILHAPKASFDPQRAKALGVPPGPLYGQLKQGTGVWINSEQSFSTGNHPAEKSGRFIHPNSVKQATVGSRSMYVSLVLDGNDSGDVAAALESLFGRDAAVDEEHQEGITPVRSDGTPHRGELFRFLAHWHPSLLTCDDVHHTTSEGMTSTLLPLMERRIVLMHVVHVQHAEYFSQFSTATGTSSVAVQGRYVASIFARVCPEIRSQAVQYFRSNVRSGIVGSVSSVVRTTGTRHHFCAAIQQKFSAFPTALAHRYHLNCIAKAQFPLSPLLCETGDDDNASAALDAGVGDNSKMRQEIGLIWPYSVKHLLIPSEAAMHIPDDQRNAITLSSLSSSPLSPADSTKQNPHPKKIGSSNSKKEDASGLLRYPTGRSAVSMLSEQFRSTVSELQQQNMIRQSSSGSYYHDDSDNNPDIALGGDGDRHKWRLDGGGALTFLGTGSAIPSKYRNVSGTYLEVMYHARHTTSLCRAIVVLDFGEANAGQLAMLLGSDCNQALNEFLRDLLFVFISHAHADHHLGLMSLIELRHRLRLRGKEELNNNSNLMEPLLIVCPQEVQEFLQDTWGSSASYRHWLQEEVVFDIIPAERYRAEGFPTTSVSLPRLNSMCARLNGITAVPTSENKDEGASLIRWAAEVFPVHHPANAHALLLRFPAPLGTRSMPRVFLFSGDTRPSSFLIERCQQFTKWTHNNNNNNNNKAEEEAGDSYDKGVFLCLHEATFGEGCEEEAVQKCHSTLPEALQVAAEIRAKHIVLNHFSQRYPKLPGLMKSQLDGRDVDLRCRRRRGRPVESVDAAKEQPPGCGAGAGRMCFGFDFMRLSFASLENQETAKLTPLFVQLLEEYESWGVGTTKRLRE